MHLKRGTSTHSFAFFPCAGFISVSAHILAIKSILARYVYHVVVLFYRLSRSGFEYMRKKQTNWNRPTVNNISGWGFNKYETSIGFREKSWCTDSELWLCLIYGTCDQPVKCHLEMRTKWQKPHKFSENAVIVAEIILLRLHSARQQGIYYGTSKFQCN